MLGGPRRRVNQYDGVRRGAACPVKLRRAVGQRPSRLTLRAEVDSPAPNGRLRSGAADCAGCPAALLARVTRLAPRRMRRTARDRARNRQAPRESLGLCAGRDELALNASVTHLNAACLACSEHSHERASSPPAIRNAQRGRGAHMYTVEALAKEFISVLSAVKAGASAAAGAVASRENPKVRGYPCTARRTQPYRGAHMSLDRLTLPMWSSSLCSSQTLTQRTHPPADLPCL
jgi:hypothetical protein